MKILHVNAGLENGGGLTHIVNLLTEAKKAHQEFELLVFADGPVAKAAQKAGIKTHILGTSSRYDLLSLTKLKNFINANHYDIVHTHGARANLYLALIKNKILAKWCLTVHSDPYLDFAGRGLLGKIFTYFNVKALKKCDYIFAVTKKFKRLLVSKVGLTQDQVHVIYNGITFHDNQEVLAKYDDQTYFNIINVARVEKIKGQDLLLKALKQLNNSHVRLHIAGDGSQMTALKSLSNQLGLAPQVTFHGFMTQKQLRNLYRRMNLAVLTSYSESFPLVLLEASDSLLPILSTAVGDITQMIPDKQHGFVAKVGDVDSIAKKLNQAINLDKSTLSQMAVREKRYLAENFSLKNQLQSILEVYQAILIQD